jgi:excisionase family DNA binding protein
MLSTRNQLPRLAYGVVEAAVLLGVSPDTVRAWIRSGRLEARRAGSRSASKLLIAPEALESFLARLEPVGGSRMSEAVGV